MVGCIVIRCSVLNNRAWRVIVIINDLLSATMCCHTVFRFRSRNTLIGIYIGPRQSVPMYISTQLHIIGEQTVPAAGLWFFDSSITAGTAE